MKRSGPLRRTGGLARTGPPARRAALTTTRSLTTGQPLTRTKRIAPQSERRRAEAPARAAVRDATHTRDRGCQAAVLVPEVACWGPLDVDEITPRGVRPGAHLEHDQTQVLCRGHHGWKDANPVEAHARGLRRWSWENP